MWMLKLRFVRTVLPKAICLSIFTSDYEMLFAHLCIRLQVQRFRIEKISVENVGYWLLDDADFVALVVLTLSLDT